MDYSYEDGRVQIRYTLSEGMLSAAVANGVTMSLRVTGGDVRVRKMRILTPWFYRGIGRFVVPLLIVSAFAILDSSRASVRWFVSNKEIVAMIVMLVAGLTIILWRRVFGYSFTRGKEGITVWRDPAINKHFEDFIAHVIAAADKK